MSFLAVQIRQKGRKKIHEMDENHHDQSGPGLAAILAASPCFDFELCCDLSQCFH